MSLGMSQAILKAAGIDPNSVVRVKYEHAADDAPLLTVTLIAWNEETLEFDHIEQRWAPVEDAVA